jgi:rubrerythrin
MPEFANPFSGMTPDRKMTFGELTRAIRLDLAAEEEAINLYEAQADATDNELAKTVLRDVANEERVHAGEFQRLLNILLADEEGFMREGAEEVDEMREGGPEAKNAGGEEGGSTVPAKSVGNLRNKAIES